MKAWEKEFSEIIEEGSARITAMLRKEPYERVHVWALHTRPDGSRGEIVAKTDSDETYPDAPIGSLTYLHVPNGSWNSIPYADQCAVLRNMMRSIPILSTSI